MACNAPLTGWVSKTVEPSGRRRVVFTYRDGYSDRPVVVPCGKCAACVLERSRQWAVRCVHEASMWESNSFVTLTYSDEHLRYSSHGVATLTKEDFPAFMKRLRERRRASFVGGVGELFVGPRFMQAGEYGAYGRPHHHAILFNCGFPDRTPWSGSEKSRLFRSRELESLWPYGYSTVGEVTYESAAYVARYTLKKIAALAGAGAQEVGTVRSDLLDSVGGSLAAPVVGGPRGGEARPTGCSSVGVGPMSRFRLPEFFTMSRKPGIGAHWLQKFMKDVYPSDSVVVRGRECKPPRFYDEKYGDRHPEALVAVKGRRAVEGRARSWRSGSPEDREEILRDSLAKSRRKELG